jgi:hypothetical protein
MKLTLGICLIALVCGANANIVYPEALFTDAIAKQAQINEMQTEIFTTIMGLRIALSNVLKKTSNLTLSDIEADVLEIFRIDAPYRTILFEDHTQNTECLMNMRNRLNFETEFTGFQSGNCLRAYDNEVSVVIDEAYKTVGLYDGELTEFELSVIEAFAGKNVWTQADDITSRYNSSFERFSQLLADLKAKIDGLVLNIENQIEAHRTNLNACYKDNQASLSTFLVRFETQLNTCIRFDNRS